MKKIVSIGLVLGVVLLAASMSYAHMGEDFFAVQVPIDMMSPVQNVVLDGDESDWDMVDPAFWITHDDLVENQNEQGINSADLAERIIIGWSPESNMVYWFEERFDDCWWGMDAAAGQEGVELVIDADHSGGQYNRMQTVDEDPARWNGSHAQNWRYYPAREDPVWHWGNATWVFVAPFAEFGWSWDGTENSGPGTATIEMSVTAFDDLNPTGIGDSIVHQFTEADGDEKVIGLGFMVQDTDCTTGLAKTGMVNSGGGNYTSNGGSTTMNQNADFINDFTLLSFDQDQWPTAVESDTWGRIKSSFNKN